MVYLDSSAVMKLVVEEPESSALRRHLRTAGRTVSAELLRTEVMRASLRVSQAHAARARQVIGEIDLITLDRFLLERAGELSPPEVRSLDAIHVAAGLVMGEALDEFVTYDARMADAAMQWGLRVGAPV